MWLCTATRMCRSSASPPIFSCSRWATAFQRRCKASSSSTSSGSRSRGGFRARAVDLTPFQVKPNVGIPLWKPSAAYMRYKPIRWLSDNLFALATYQLSLELGFTVVFGSLLYADMITAQGVCDRLAEYHYPFVHWIDVDAGVYTEPVRVGPFELNPVKISALHTGHNIANGLLPLQAVLLLTTFSPVYRVYGALRRIAPVSADAVTLASRAPGAAAVSSQPSQGPRRASYTRSTPSRPSSRDDLFG